MYANVNAANASGILAEMNSWLGSNGWTTLYSAIDGLGWTAGSQLHLQSPSGNYFFNLYADNTNKRIHTTISSAMGDEELNLGAQTGESNDSRTDLLFDNYENVFLFSSGDSVYCVVEIQPNRFRHFAVGVIDKSGGDGAWVGGQFSVGTQWASTVNDIQNLASEFHCVLWDGYSTRVAYGNNNHDNIIRVTLNSVSYDRKFGRNAYNNSDNNARAQGLTRPGYGMFSSLLENCYSNTTGRTMLVPIHIIVRDPTNSFYVPLGTVSDVRSTRLNFYNPKDVITIGADEWQIFPLVVKNGASGTESSGTYGLAYKR